MAPKGRAPLNTSSTSPSQRGGESQRGKRAPSQRSGGPADGGTSQRSGARKKNVSTKEKIDAREEALRKKAEAALAARRAADGGEGGQTTRPALKQLYATGPTTAPPTPRSKSSLREALENARRECEAC